MTVGDLAYAASDRLGIRVRRHDGPFHGHVAPAGCVGIETRSRTVLDLYHHGTDDEHVWHLLHDIAHVYFWDVFGGVMDADEEMLLAWEHAVAKTWSCGQLYLVADYTAGTTLAPAHLIEVGEWSHPQRSAWWRSAVRRCKRLGVLDDRGRPTWATPKVTA